jgi:hypothetical protein
MNQELKAKWVEALRSGEYKQTTGELHDRATDSYCCLGVLCRVVGAEFGDVMEHNEDDGEWVSHDYVPHIGGKVLAADEELKASVCEEFGIPDQTVLISMNDGNEKEEIRSHTFSEIANFIEKNL